MSVRWGPGRSSLQMPGGWHWRDTIGTTEHTERHRRHRKGENSPRGHRECRERGGTWSCVVVTRQTRLKRRDNVVLPTPPFCCEALTHSRNRKGDDVQGMNFRFFGV